MLQLIIIGLSAFYLTNLARRLPRIEALAMAGKKPWACNACMSFWTMTPAAFFHSQQQGGLAWPMYLAASGLCFFLLEFLDPPPPELPPIPPDAK